MRFAKIVSIILHPLWMPVIIYSICLWCDPFILVTPALNGFVYLLLAVNVIAPAASIYIMARFGLLNNIELRNRTDRTGPYLLVLFYYVMSYLVLRWKAAFLPVEIVSWFLTISVSLLLSLLINTYWKISVHLLAQGGLFGMLLALQKLHHIEATGFIVVSLVLAGLTAYSRVKLDAHTPGQTYAGFFLGFVVNYIIVGFNVII